MFIAKNCNVYDDVIYFEGETIEDIVAQLETENNNHISFNELEFFECNPVIVKRNFIIE